MLLRLEGEGALNERLYRSLRREILEGRCPPGSHLPSTRVIARDLGISRNVVLLAFARLVDEGYAVTRAGSGTIVSATLPDALLRPRSRLPQRAVSAVV